jgi:N-acyl-D-amino-acid deacylase
VLLTPRRLLEGGLVIDGTGAPGVVADVLLHGDRIESIGPHLRAQLSSNDAARCDIVDCRGLVVAPGFIDAHTHDDAIALQQPSMRAKVSQGVTTVIAGNCGISLVPLVSRAPPSPLTLLGSHSFQHATMASYRAAFLQAQPAVNVALLIGHTTLRAAVMAQLDRAATADELVRMATLLDQALRDGAIGLSSGLFYDAAFAAPASEVIALAKVVARHGGVYTSHLRTEMHAILDALQEAGDTALAGGVPLIVSHHKCAGPSQWGRTRETLPFIERLATRQPVAMDVYPYTAGSTVLRDDLVDGVIDVRVTWSDTHPQAEGRWLHDIARDWGVSQQEACRRLQPGGACYFHMHEDDVDRVVAHPMSMIGSDGLPHDRHPHPRLWGTFARVLGHHCREKRLFTLEQAIHKMTGLSARCFKLHQRGVLQPGWFADVVVLDAEQVSDRATYDNPRAESVGMHAVFVNGMPAHASADFAARLPTQRAGRLLQHATAA